ncbi:NAD(P)-binding protein [Artomyces pyxidatus]|uniref:NAD(P)-binding protein n=1 Tax=Artomyces pyxidatus TaxID=48021 RepID=A0ACB8TF35_9AGAM|nr:NAD(P)-binding protein [Artomyces pyxidatus]
MASGKESHWSPVVPELKGVAAENEGKGRRAHIFAGDVSQEQDVIDMTKGVVDTLGGCVGFRCMVANAGVCTLRKVVDATVENFDHHYAVNARGVMLCYKHAAIQMIAQGRGGRLIAASSLFGKRGSELFFAYAASKFAVRGLTHAAAEELGKYGITANTYCPGAIDTTMLKNSMEELLGVEGARALRKRILESTPMGRSGLPSDLASVVSFLASKESSFITGQSVRITLYRLLRPY